MASKLGDGEIVIYMEMFKLSFRLSIQTYFARMLVRIGLIPSELDPNGWKIYVVCMFCGPSRIEPRLVLKNSRTCIYVMNIG